jgi:hypothetical protein
MGFYHIHAHKRNEEGGGGAKLPKNYAELNIILINKKKIYDYY